MTRKKRNEPSEPQRLVAKARARHALSFLMNLVVVAKQQTDVVTWQRLGGLEAEDALDAWERAVPHPFFDDYAARRAAGGHPGPSLRERHFQRLAVLLSVALQRTKLATGRARQTTARALTGATLLGQPTAKQIEHWELKLEPPLSAADEVVIRTALERCGNDRERLVRHFLSFIRFPWLPL